MTFKTFYSWCVCRYVKVFPIVNECFHEGSDQSSWVVGNAKPIFNVFPLYFDVVPFQAYFVGGRLETNRYARHGRVISLRLCHHSVKTKTKPMFACANFFFRHIIIRIDQYTFTQH